MSRILPVFAGTVLLAAGLASAGTVRLQYRYPHGRVLNYRLDVVQGVELASDLAPGITRRVRLECGSRLSSRVLRVDDAGAAELQFDYRLERARQSEGGQAHRLEQLENLPPLSVRLRRDRRGRVQDSVSPSGRGGHLERLAASLYRAQQTLALEFPGGELAPGRRWTIERRLQLPLFGGGDLELAMRGNYRLQRLYSCRHQRCARIGADFEVQLRGSSGSGEFHLQADMQGRGRASYLFGVDSGTLLRARGELRVAGRLAARAGDDSAGSRLVITMTSTTELVE